jgi:hypothetical protein
VPDAQALLPGDVLLVTGPGPVPWLIRSVQEYGGFHPDHARWTHIALYIGRGRLVEATPFGGVRVALFVDMTFGRELLVRRRQANPQLAPEHRYDIAIHALTDLRRGYSLDTIPRLAWQAWRRKLWANDQRPDVRHATICSTVIRNAYTTAIYTDLLPGMIGVTWPADLSQTPELDDVPIGWAKIVA